MSVDVLAVHTHDGGCSDFSASIAFRINSPTAHGGHGHHALTSRGTNPRTCDMRPWCVLIAEIKKKPEASHLSSFMPVNKDES